MKNIFKMLGLIPEDRGRLVAAVLISLLLGLGNIASPYIYKFIVDALVKLVASPGAAAVAYHTITMALLFLLALRLAMAIIGWIQEAVSDGLFINIATGLRQKVFSHIATLSIDYFEKNRVGELTERINGGIFDFALWVGNAAENVLVNIATLLFALTLIWFKNVYAGLIVTVIVPISIGYRVWRLQRTRALRKEAYAHLDIASGHMAETFANITTVRSFANEESSVSRYHEQLTLMKDKNRRRFSLEHRANFIRQLFETAAIVGVIGITAAEALRGRYTPGDILLISLYVQQITSSLRPLGRLIVTTSEVDTSAERIIVMLREKTRVDDKPDAKDLKTINSLQFKNVSFAYPGKKRLILDRISFRLDRNQTLALVGPSGVGKSTITKLVMRFYEPTGGQILVNGEDISEFKQDSLRRHMGVVMQDVALFNDTIEENVRFANADASKKALKQAAVLAHADNFIAKLPSGYGTLVGERGIKLSGGEKQRVAIARAILKDPDLVILDEATSALDSESERQVKAGLEALTRDKTTLVIAHRLSTVMKAHQILVLKNGKVVERGNHKALLKKKGLYEHLFSLQSI